MPLRYTDVEALSVRKYEVYMIKEVGIKTAFVQIGLFLQLFLCKNYLLYMYYI